MISIVHMKRGEKMSFNVIDFLEKFGSFVSATSR